MAVQRMIATHELPAVIIRPDQIFGPGDRLHFGQTAERLSAGKAVIVGRGDNKIPLVYVSDVVQSLLLAIDHDRAVGEAFNITSDIPITQQEFLDGIAAEIGANPRRIHIPYRTLYAGAALMEYVVAKTRMHYRPPITRLGVAFLGTSMRFSIEKARREIGFEPQVPLSEGIRRAAAWYLENRQEATVQRAHHEESAPLPLGR
jgi:nucleoside-diphosphate-sugar epimerase